MTRSIAIPTSEANQIEISLDSEHNAVFVLGANGSGKSALLHWLYVYGLKQTVRQDGSRTVRRIKAHRMTSLSTNRVDISASQFAAQSQHVHQDDSNNYGRYLDRLVPDRSQGVMYELQRAEMGRLAGIGRRFESARTGKTGLEAAEQFTDASLSPIETINRLFQSAGLSVEVEISEDAPDMLLARHRKSGVSYGVEQLSDGERSSLLLAAQVLCAPADTVFLIDEPERHLHRSIAGPLLAGLFATRRDCEFVVATHEISLPHDCHDAHVLLLRGCEFGEDTAQSWDADLMSPGADIDDDIKLDVWGARRHLVYVEGKPHSLDKRLYESVFTDVSFVARDGWQQVAAAVRAARGSHDLHWMQVHGLIDRDRHEADTLDDDARHLVCVLGCYAIESIYYCAEAQRSAGADLARDAGVSIEARLADARRVVLAEAQTLAGVAYVDGERLSHDIESQDAEAIIANYPIKKSTIPDRIASSFGFATRRAYEQAVRVALRNDETLRTHVADMCGGLREALERSGPDFQSDAAPSTAAKSALTDATAATLTA
jgi:ABC-type cobalamin/Fe3+-siderophores transport system ATPase subunit